MDVHSPTLLAASDFSPLIPHCTVDGSLFATDGAWDAKLLIFLPPPDRCELGGLVVHPNVPAPFYEFELLNRTTPNRFGQEGTAGDGGGEAPSVFLHFRVRDSLKALKHVSLVQPIGL